MHLYLSDLKNQNINMIKLSRFNIIFHDPGSVIKTWQGLLDSVTQTTCTTWSSMCEQQNLSFSVKIIKNLFFHVMVSKQSFNTLGWK